jgi:hypothetical protein
MRRVDLRIGFAEAASENSVTLRIERELSRPGIRRRLSFIVPASPSSGSDEADASWDPRHSRLR